MKRIVFSICAMLTGSAVFAGTAETAAEVNWQSTPGRPELLATEISELYQSLYNAGNLRVQEVINTSGEDAQTAMRRLDVFLGSGFPWVIDNIVCDLNPEHCSRPRSVVSDNVIGDLTAHVGGFSISNSRFSNWNMGKGDVLTVPDYNYRSFTALQRVAVPKGWTPSQAVVSEMADCSRWKADCEEVIRRYNPSRVPLKFDGFAILPVVSVETRIPLKTESTAADGGIGGSVPSTRPNVSSFEKITTRQATIKKQVSTYSTQKSGSLTGRLENHWTGVSRNDAVLKKLQRNLGAIGALTGHATVTEEPAYANQKVLFDMIHHPFGQGAELSQAFRNPVDVMVMDSKLIENHCDLPNALFADAPEDAAPCNEELGDFVKKRDHAAHVIGMIAAPVNGQGMVGLNPSARMHFREVPITILGQGEAQRYNDAFDEARDLEVRVINASIGMTPDAGNTRFLEFGIQQLSKTALVVASAGNGARELTDLCDVFPACYHKEPNVITVVGLSKGQEQLALWREEGEDVGSNSSEHFHIAAVAKKVLSTVEGHKLAWVSGTSVAAPQVSATASLIYSATEAAYPDKLNELGVLPPIAVKNRLLYTADIHRHLKRKVFSGLLNVSRAIEIKYSQLEYLDEGVLKAVKGHVVELETDTVICRMEDGTKSEHAWRDIRRMYFDPGTDRTILYKLKQADNPESEIEEAICPRVLTQSNKITIELPDSQTVKLEMRQMRDFTSALFPLPPEYSTQE